VSRRPPTRSAWWAGTLLALTLLLPAGNATAETHRLALIASQNHGGEGTVPLRYADADAWKLREVLVELGGFDRARVRFLPDVSRNQLIAALVESGRQAATLQANGEDEVLLLVFYSGHADREGLRLGRSTVSYEELEHLVESSGARVRLQIIDACHAGQATRIKGASPVPSFVVEMDPELASEGRVIITSSAADEVSQESDDIGGSYFTHFVVSGLRGAADHDGDLRISLDELYRYLYQETLFHTSGTRAGPQHPSYEYDLRGQGAIVLSEIEGPSASLVFPGDGDGQYWVFDRRNRAFIGEVNAPDEPVRLAVAPGRYLVQRRTTENLQSAEIQLWGGDEVDVDGLAMVDQDFDDDPTKGGIALRWQRRTRFLVRVGGGVHTVPQTELAAEYFPTMPLVNLALGVEWRTLPRMELTFDGAFGHARYEMNSFYTTEISETHLDIGASYRLVQRVGVLRLAVGPRFSLLSYHREPLGDSLAGFSVGVDGGLGLRFDDRAGFALDGRAGYLLNRTAVENQSHVHIQVLLRLELAL